MSDRSNEPYALLERVFREEAGRLTASLVRHLGDFDLAEELVSLAVVEALDHWPRDGVPERPAAWLLTTARRKGLDQLRRNAIYRDKLREVAALGERVAIEPDDRLRLIFTCCHPVLAREAQIALALRAVVGLTTSEIARAFLVSEDTVGRRISRAKRKIVSARVPYRIPAGDEIDARIEQALTVVYLIFNEGYLATAGDRAVRRDVASDAEWLASLMCSLLPGNSEALALVALIRLNLARWNARIGSHGRLVLLDHQDRSRWDHRAIDDALGLVARTAHKGPPGRFQIEAAIAAVHCEAPSWEATDWPQILALYTVLLSLDPSPVVRLSRAVALSQVLGPERALAEVDALEDALSHYHLFHATRASLLERLGRRTEARAANEAALTLTRNVGERVLLEERISI